MIKNGIYEGTVSGLGTDGEGIITTEGTTAFVSFCLKGEKVSFKALKIGKGVAYGKLEKVIVPAAERTVPPCPVFGKCGGCALQHMSYEAQLDFKREQVQSALRKIGNISAAVADTVPCESEYRYRNKLAMPVGVDSEGGTVLGFYAPHSHRIVPVADCLIQSEWVAAVVSAVKKFAKEAHIGGYNEKSRSGELRHIVVREIKGKFVFALVATRKIDCSALISELEKHFADFTFVLNVNRENTNPIFGKEWHICRGNGVINAEDGGIKYGAGVNTFIQVNDGMRAKLYDRVLSEVPEGAVALDLYSGGGMLTAMLAKKCGLAYGIEIVKEASERADELAKENGLRGKMFNICGAVEDKIEEAFAATAGRRRVIVCDPPRKGMERSAVRAVARSGADKVIFVSCNPATLARDAGLLTGALKEENGALVKAVRNESEYEIESVTPFDMFSQTKWCETVCVMKRKNKSV